MLAAFLPFLLLLTWSYPWGSDPAYSVVIQRRDQAGVYTSDLATLVGAQTSYSDNTVTAGTAYCYHMAAQDAAGVRSVYGPDTCLTAGTGPLTLTIIWPTSDPREWIIERKEGAGAFSILAILNTTPTSPTSYVDAATIPGRTYTYRVAGRNWVGQGQFSSEATATVPPITIPNSASSTTLTLVLRGSIVTLPQDLTATVIDPTNIRLNWTPPTDPNVGWAIVQVSINGGAFNLVNDSKTAASAGQYSYVPPSVGTFKFRLRMWDQATQVPFGFSNESNAVTI